jgi:hypothetical protein
LLFRALLLSIVPRHYPRGSDAAQATVGVPWDAHRSIPGPMVCGAAWSSAAPGGARLPPLWPLWHVLLTRVWVRLHPSCSPPWHAVRRPWCDAAPRVSLRTSSGSNSHCRMPWPALSCHLSPLHHVIHDSHPAGGCFAFGNGQAVALRQSASVGSTWGWQCLAVGDVKCERVTVSSVKMDSGMVTTL